MDAKVVIPKLSASLTAGAIILSPMTSSGLASTESQSSLGFRPADQWLPFPVPSETGPSSPQLLAASACWPEDKHMLKDQHQEQCPVVYVLTNVCLGVCIYPPQPAEGTQKEGQVIN